MKPALFVKGLGVLLGLIVVTLKNREPFDADFSLTPLGHRLIDFGVTDADLNAGVGLPAVTRALFSRVGRVRVAGNAT